MADFGDYIMITGKFAVFHCFSQDKTREISSTPIWQFTALSYLKANWVLIYDICIRESSLITGKNSVQRHLVVIAVFTQVTIRGF